MRGLEVRTQRREKKHEAHGLPDGPNEEFGERLLQIGDKLFLKAKRSAQRKNRDGEMSIHQAQRLLAQK